MRGEQVIMAEPYRLTILADKPDGAGGIDDTGFIDAAAAAFEAIPGCKLARAATILDVDSALSDAEVAAGDRPISVQIVGHGTSGQLLLGMTWIAEDVARTYPFYLIDTNPVALGFFRNHRGKLANLTLVGCHVGATGNPEIEDDAVNGRSLTFVLSELLQCHVDAPIDYVAATDFNDGLYTGTLNGWEWGNPVGPPSWKKDVPRIDEAHAGDATTLEIDRIDRTALALKSRGPHAIANPIKLDSIEIEKAALAFATPELEVNLTTEGPARIVGNRRYVVTKDGKRQFAIKNRDLLTRELRRALWAT